MNKFLKMVFAGVVLSVSSFANAGFVYIDSNVGNPWGETSNEASMDGVFGSGAWDDLNYETVNVATLFSASSDFIYMEGGDFNANELEAFILANQTAMESWVFDGGRLFINSAPNEGDGMSFGFGVSLVYPDIDLNVSGVDAAHAIFNGPFGATGANFSGTDFSHATVSGVNLNDLIIGDVTSNTVLGDMFYGSGYAIFGGMTTLNWQNPNAFELRQNIIHNAANVALVPEPSTLAIFALGLMGLASRRFKKHS